jgi:hypothetical protein
MADKLLDTLQEPAEHFDMEMGVFKVQRSGMTMSASFWFMTCREFTIHFKMEAKAVGLKLIKMTCEEGQKALKGVLVKPSPSDPQHMYRLVTFFNETQWHVSETHLQPDRRLLGSEPVELFNILNRTNSQNRQTD